MGFSLLLLMNSILRASIAQVWLVLTNMPGPALPRVSPVVRDPVTPSATLEIHKGRGDPPLRAKASAR